MLLLLRNRIKLFYRPAGLAGDPERMADKLSFSVVREGAEWKITATNDSAFHISLVDTRITGAGADIVLTPDMIAPKARFDWRIKSDADLLAAGRRIQFKFVNDYGGDTAGEIAGGGTPPGTIDAGGGGGNRDRRNDPDYRHRRHQLDQRGPGRARSFGGSASAFAKATADKSRDPPDST